MLSFYFFVAVASLGAASISPLVESETGMEIRREISYGGRTCKVSQIGWIHQSACYYCPTVNLAAAGTYDCTQSDKEVYYFRNHWTWNSLYGTLAVRFLGIARRADGTPFFSESEMNWVRRIVTHLDTWIPAGSELVMMYDGQLTVKVTNIDTFTIDIPRFEFRRVADYFKANAFIETWREAQKK